MKKTLSVIFISMLILSLAACSNSDNIIETEGTETSKHHLDEFIALYVEKNYGNDTESINDSESEIEYNRDESNRVEDVSFAGEYASIIKASLNNASCYGDSDILDNLGIQNETKFNAVCNVINQLALDNGYESIEIIDKADENIEQDRYDYIILSGYDYWIVMYFPENDIATAYQDPTGYISSIYDTEIEEDIEWDD